MNSCSGCLVFAVGLLLGVLLLVFLLHSGIGGVAGDLVPGPAL